MVAIICFHNTVSMRKINHSMYFYPRSEPNQMHPRVCTSHTCLHLIKCIFHAIKTTTINGLIHMYIKKNLPCMNMLCFKPLCIWVYIDSSLAPQGSYSKYWAAEVVRMGMHSGRTTPFLINTINMPISKYPH